MTSCLSALKLLLVEEESFRLGMGMPYPMRINMPMMWANQAETTLVRLVNNRTRIEK